MVSQLVSLIKCTLKGVIGMKVFDSHAHIYRKKDLNMTAGAIIQDRHGEVCIKIQ